MNPARTRSLLLSLALAGFLPSSFATVTIGLQADRLNDGTGGAAPADSLVLLVADTTGNGLATVKEGSAALGTLLDGADDRVVARASISANEGILDAYKTGLALGSGWTSGDNLYLVWFPSLAGTETTLPDGTAYGKVLVGTTPNDGNTVSFTYITAEQTVGVFGAKTPYDANTVADQTVRGPAPEITVRGNGQVIADGDSTPSTSDSTDFGGTAIGAPLFRDFTIRNDGTADLTISGLGAGTGDFSITVTPAATVAAGGSTTFRVTFNPTAAGVSSATVSFTSNDGDEPDFDFAVQGTGLDNSDPDGNGFGDSEESLVAAQLLQYTVGETITPINLGFIDLTGGKKLVVTGLPPGLRFDATNKTISGTILGELGATELQIQKVTTRVVKLKINKKTVSKTYTTVWAVLPVNMSINPYQFRGGYEALILDPSVTPAKPVGKASLLITGPFAYTATLQRQGEAARSTRGTFASEPTDTDKEIVVNFPRVTFPKPKGRPAPTPIPAAQVTFNISSTSNEVTGSTDANNLDGFRLATPARAPRQLLTAVFEYSTPGDADTEGNPGGTGYATGSFNAGSMLSLKGALGDGKAFTLGLNLSETNEAVVYLQPYAERAKSYFGGFITVGPIGLPDRVNPLEPTALKTSKLLWAKAPISTETSYRSGFGAPTLADPDIAPLEVTGRISRWIPMLWAEGVAQSLGLGIRREIAASFVAVPESSLPTSRPLPGLLGLRTAFTLVRLTPVTSVSWRGSSLPSDGSFSAIMGLKAPATSSTVSGVFLQDASFGTQVGAGLVRIPITGTGLPSGSFRTAGIRLESN